LIMGLETANSCNAVLLVFEVGLENGTETHGLFCLVRLLETELLKVLTDVGIVDDLEV
jgi:hypothetical protein